MSDQPTTLPSEQPVADAVALQEDTDTGMVLPTVAPTAQDVSDTTKPTETPAEPEQVPAVEPEQVPAAVKPEQVPAAIEPEHVRVVEPAQEDQESTPVIPQEQTGKPPTYTRYQKSWNPSTSIRSLHAQLRSTDGPGIHGGLARAKKVYGNAFPKPNPSSHDASGANRPPSKMTHVRNAAPRPSTYVHVSPTAGFTAASAATVKADFSSTYSRTTLIGNWQEDRVFPASATASREGSVVGNTARARITHPADRLRRGNVLGTEPGVTLDDASLKRVNARQRALANESTATGTAATKPGRRHNAAAKTVKTAAHKARGVTSGSDEAGEEPRGHYSETLQALVRPARPVRGQHSYGVDYFWHVSSINHSDYKWPDAERKVVYNNK